MVRRRMILLCAVSILWIYVGNIINFHQHHIWGKQLIPVACTTNRTKEKAFEQQGNILKHHSQPGFINQESIQAAEQLTAASGEISSILVVPDKVYNHSNGCIMAHALRGPPLA